MADCFISYRRKPSSSLARLVQMTLQNAHGIDGYVDVTRTDSTKVKFPERLMQAIADAPVFVCLLGERDGQHTLDSEWVLKEIVRAYEFNKFCIPVFQETYRPIEVPEGIEAEAVDYLLSFDGVHIFDDKNIMVDASINQLADLIATHIRTSQMIMPQTATQTQTSTQVQTTTKFNFLPYVAVLILAVAIIVAGLLIANSLGGTAIVPTEVAEDPAPTPMSASDILATAEAQATQVAQEQVEILQTTQAEQTQIAQEQIDIALTTTEETFLSINATQTAERFATREAQAEMTLIALSFTPTVTPTPPPTNTPEPPTLTPTPDMPEPEQVALEGVTSNAEWENLVGDEGYERTFNGVTMVLVPAGCFMMGEDNEVHPQCFDEPFWIDKYEVTQAQFASFGGTKARDNGFSGNNRPVENITWFEARDFCELRSASLPTEAQWEYAARGVESWLYPWGNDFVGDNAVYVGNSGDRTADVGSRPAGISWVGALDMIGNVWEWTSSLYESYPYDETDGREADTGLRTDVIRVLRGGSWSLFAGLLRAPNRGGFNPGLGSGHFGLRCARSYE